MNNQQIYEKKAIDKIELLKDLPIYTKAKQKLNWALQNHTRAGLEAIQAIAFLDRVIEIDVEQLKLI